MEIGDKIKIMNKISISMNYLGDEKENSENSILSYTNIKNIEEIEYKGKLKEKASSSDICSDSTSQAENISYISESSSSLFSFHTNYTQSNNYYSFTQRENKNDKQASINYFDGLENYFYKIMPEKFNDYKKTKNFVPKNARKEIISKELPINEEIIKKKDKKKIENKFDSTGIELNNDYIYSLYGNISYSYPVYNAFYYYNFPLIGMSYKELNDINEDNKIEKDIINEEANNDKNDVINQKVNSENIEKNAEKDEKEEISDKFIITKKEKKIKKYIKNENKINYNNNKKGKEYYNNKNLFEFNNNLFKNNYYFNKINNNNYCNINEFNFNQRKNYINNSKYDKFNHYNKRQFHKNLYY